MWFAAREGFCVAGINGSESAIRFARRRFKLEGLSADLRVGDFTNLPFAEDSFDLVIDRGSLTCVGASARRRAVAEVRRVMVPGGKFLFNPYSDRHTSARSGRPGQDGRTVDIMAGTLTDVGAIGSPTGKRLTSSSYRGGKRSALNISWSDSECNPAEFTPGGVSQAKRRVDISP